MNRDSAQMIITGGFIVALAIVVVTLSLNLVIFSQDLSTRDDGAWERGVADYDDVMTQVIEDGFAHANEQAREEEMPPDQITSDLYEEYIEPAAGAAYNVSAPRGVLVSQEVEPSVDSSNHITWSMTQREEGEFVNRTGEPDWVLTEPEGGFLDCLGLLGDPDDCGGDVEDALRINLNITEEIDDGDEFRVIAANEYNFSTMEVEDGYTMVVGSDEITFEDEGSGDPAVDDEWDGEGEIDVKYRAGHQMIDGEHVEELEPFLDFLRVEEDYLLRFEGGDNASGTYDVQVWADDIESQNTPPTPQSDMFCDGVGEGEACSEGSTYVTGAIWMGEGSVEYTGSDVRHSNEIEVYTP